MTELRPLRTRIRRLLLAITLVFFAVATVAAYKLERTQDESALALAMKTRIDVARSLVESTISKEQVRIGGLGRSLGSDSRGLLQSMLDNEYRVHDGIDLIYLLDARGRIALIPQPFKAFVGLDFSRIDYVQKRLPVSPVHQSLITRDSVISLLMPVPESGFLIMEKNVEGFLQLFRQLEVGDLVQDDLLFVLSSDGTVVYHQDAELVKSRHNLRLDMFD